MDKSPLMHSEFSEETKYEKTVDGTQGTNYDKIEDEIQDVELTPGEALDGMVLAWRNELSAVDLLPHRSELVDSILEQTREVEEDLKRLEKNAMGTMIRKMEIDRIRYVVTSYLRCRLKKIEKYVFHTISSDEKRKKEGIDTRMSTDEEQFALEYRRHLDEYLHAVALQKMPSNAQKLDPEQVADAPNLNNYVFVRMKHKVTDVSIQNISDDTREIEVDLDGDTQHIMPYKTAAPLIENGSAYLM